ncbi:MAG: hypothetical protein HPY85_15395 [Anaerolineae bacterium]|nr:hypothetical protein [Anaerolineae bacterium]
MQTNQTNTWLLAIWVLLLSLMITACTNGRPNDEAAIDATRALIETYVAGTQTANALPQDTPTARPTRTELPTWTPKPAATAELVAPTAIQHLVVPVGPGLAWSEIADTFSGNTAAEKRAPEGDLYTSQQLLERPFNQAMAYVPQVDIRGAELAKDNQFIYVTINLDQVVQQFDASYGVELDVDADGRGDYLVWAVQPDSDLWTIDKVFIYTDTNHDVGGANVLASDAPNGGDGFDGLLFSASQFDDPDLAWARINPDRGGSIQFAFKDSFIEGGASFFWRVWADAGLQNPAAFYYHDFYEFSHAGSPLADSEAYPLGTVFALDNTCRMPFQIANDGFEPGLCGNGGMLPTSTPAPDVSLTKLPVIPTIKLTP